VRVNGHMAIVTSLACQTHMQHQQQSLDDFSPGDQEVKSREGSANTVAVRACCAHSFLRTCLQGCSRILSHTRLLAQQLLAQQLLAHTAACVYACLRPRQRFHGYLVWSAGACTPIASRSRTLLSWSLRTLRTGRLWCPGNRALKVSNSSSSIHPTSSSRTGRLSGSSRAGGMAAHCGDLIT